MTAQLGRPHAGYAEEAGRSEGTGTAEGNGGGAGPVHVPTDEAGPAPEDSRARDGEAVEVGDPGPGAVLVEDEDAGRLLVEPADGAHLEVPPVLVGWRPRPAVQAGRAPAHSRRRPRRGRCPWWEALLVGLVGLGCALALFHTAWQYPFSTQVGSAGDAEEYSWFFSWVPYALGHGLNPLVSHYVNYPNGINLMWNTSVLLPALVLSPLTLIWDAAFSYNVAITLAPALNVLVAHWAFRRWASPVPALVGALVFGFSPYMVAQSVGHLAQTLTFSAPLLLVALDRLLVLQKGRAWREGAVLGILAWAQLVTGEEVLAMEAATVLVAVAVLYLVSRPVAYEKLHHAMRGGAVAALTAGVLSAPFLAVQYLGPDRVQDPHPANAYVSDLLNFFVPTNITKLAPRAALAISSHFTGNGSEQGAYIGIPLVLFLLFALYVARRRKVTWVALAVALGAGVLSMGPYLHVGGTRLGVPLPGDLLAHLPAYHNLLPDRFASIMTLGVGWLVALGLTEVGRLGRRARPAKVGSWLVVGTGLAALFPITAYPAGSSPLYAAFDTGLSCPLPANGQRAHGHHPPVALLLPTHNELELRWQAEARFCFVMPGDAGMTGSSSTNPKALPMMFNVGTPGAAMPPLTAATRQAAAAYLHQLGVSEVVVAPESPSVPNWTPDGQAKLVVWLEWLFGQAPQQSPGPYISYAWRHLPSTADIASGHVGRVPGEA